MTTPGDGELATSLGAVFEELVNLIHEAKQAAWSASNSDHRHRLERVKTYLAEQAVAIDEGEQQVGGRPSWVVSPTGYRSRNLAAEAGGDPDRFIALLVDHLRALVLDMRERSGAMSGDWSVFLSSMADGIEKQIEILIP